MIKHHLRYAVRHLRKKTTYTALNVFGLSIGLACAALIAFWVRAELSYDRFHVKSDRIYRVVSKFTNESSVVEQAITSAPLAPALIKDIPEIEQAVRIDPSDAVVALGDVSFLEEGLFTDQSFLDVFDFKLLSGDRKSALKEPYTIILSESMAKKYFGDADPMGQLIKIFAYDPDGQGAQYKITGVIENCPANSHFSYDYLISFTTAEINRPEILTNDHWFNNNFYTYILLHPDAHAATVQEKITGLLKTYGGETMAKFNFQFEYSLQALADIHLNSNLSYEIGSVGSMSYVIIFATVGLFVLMLACINYINMSTAYATERFKEVGMHKVLGALRGQLISQYLTESWLLATAALVIAFGWIELSRPLFESITDTKFVGSYSFQSIGLLFAITSFIGLIAGFYPAIVLSGVKPVNILKRNAAGLSGSFLRKILVVVQFSVTIILVIGIIVVQLQMDFIQSKDLGFDKNNLVVFGVHGSPEVYSGYKGFADELAQNPNIGGIALSNTTIGNGLNNFAGIVEDVDGHKVNLTVYDMGVDYNYMDVYRMSLIAGRNFRVDNAADSTRALIVNESLAKSVGYLNPSDILGKPFQRNGVTAEVIGVVKDFNFNSLQHKVEPLCMYPLGRGFSRISIRINGDTRKGFEEVQSMWRKHFPSSVLQYAFYEDSLASSYQAEARFSGVFFIFSIISLVIACLGLFALVSYTVERRSKEIGIRKVLGATVSNILSMLSSEFLILVGLSSIVAIPVGYYFMSEWLAGFAYHVSLNALMFVAAGVLVLVVACVTVSLRTFRAASANPVTSLRSE